MSTNGKPDKFIESVINSIAEPITVINSEYEIMWTNRADREFLFRSGASLKSFLCYECHHKKDSPCDEADYDCPLNRIRSSHKPLTVIHEHFRADGQKRFLEIVSTPLMSAEGAFQGVIDVARDITEQKKMSEKSDLLGSIIEIVPDSICSIDREGTIHTWNEGAEKMFGYKAEELMGKSITTVMPRVELDHFLNVLDAEGFFFRVRVRKDIKGRAGSAGGDHRSNHKG
jgi:PAS domain-containing protein